MNIIKFANGETMETPFVYAVGDIICVNSDHWERCIRVTGKNGRLHFDFEIAKDVD